MTRYHQQKPSTIPPFNSEQKSCQSDFFTKTSRNLPDLARVSNLGDASFRRSGDNLPSATRARGCRNAQIDTGTLYLPGARLALPICANEVPHTPPFQTVSCGKLEKDDARGLPLAIVALGNDEKTVHTEMTRRQCDKTNKQTKTGRTQLYRASHCCFAISLKLPRLQNTCRLNLGL
jgi:hypothetical protein